MEKRQLGDSGVEVSTVALGSWLTYSGGIGREQTEACTRAAFDAGITLFDTANVYGTGAAETAWGEILRDYARDSYVLATKLYFPMGPRDRGLSRKQILKQIDGSLARLQTDYVDLYQCHRYDDYVAARGDDGRADRGRRGGQGAADRVLASGRRTRSPRRWRCRAWRSSSPRSRSTRALWRKPEAEVIPVCEANGITQIVWSPLAQGVLTGKYRPGEKVPADSRAANKSMNRFIKQWLKDDTLTRRAERCGRSPTRRASRSRSSRWRGCCTSRTSRAVIVGATRPEQVHENVAAADVKLSADTLAAIDDALRTAAVL